MRRAVGLGDLSSASGLSRLLRACGPFDIVHGHSSKAGALVRLLPHGGRRTVYSPHAFATLDRVGRPFRTGLYEAAERLLMVRTDLLVATSTQEAREARRLGAPPRRIALVVNGMERPDYLPRDEARRRLGVPQSAVCVGFIGRMTSQKRPQRFVEVLAGVQGEEVAGRQVWGAMIGHGEDRAQVEGLIASKGLAARVALHQSVSAWTLMLAFDVLVMTSAYEGMPYVLLEALHAGLPVVTDDVGGVSEMVGDGENGFVSHPCTAPKLVSAKLQRLVQDETLRGRMGRASLERARRFSVEAMAEGLTDAYQATLSRARARA